MKLSRAKLEQTLHFFEQSIPVLIDSGLDPAVAIERISRYVLEETSAEDKSFVRDRFETMLASVGRKSADERVKEGPIRMRH